MIFQTQIALVMALTSGEIMNRVDIKSSKTDAVLSFSDLTSRGFEVSYHSKYVSARTTVFDVDEARIYLQELFSLMAQQLNGWQGELSWAPIGEYVKILSTVDRTGHVELRIVFDRISYTEPWQAETILYTELGQLEKISRDISKFFSR